MWKNKMEIINVLSNQFKKNNCKVLQGVSDVDTLILSEILDTTCRNEAAVTLNNIDMGNKQSNHFNSNHLVKKIKKSMYRNQLLR